MLYFTALNVDCVGVVAVTSSETDFDVYQYCRSIEQLIPLLSIYVHYLTLSQNKAYIIMSATTSAASQVGGLYRFDIRHRLLSSVVPDSAFIAQSAPAPAQMDVHGEHVYISFNYPVYGKTTPGMLRARIDMCGGTQTPTSQAEPTATRNVSASTSGSQTVSITKTESAFTASLSSDVPTLTMTVSRSASVTTSLSATPIVWCEGIVVSSGGVDALGDGRAGRIEILIKLHGEVWNPNKLSEIGTCIRLRDAATGTVLSNAELSVAQSTTAMIEPGTDERVLRVVVGYSQDFVPDADVVVSVESLGAVTLSGADPTIRGPIVVRKTGQAASTSAQLEKHALKVVATTAVVNAAAFANIQSMAVVASLSCLPARVRKQSYVVSWVISPLFDAIGPFAGAHQAEDSMVVWNIILLLALLAGHFTILCAFRSRHFDVTWERTMRRARFPNITLRIFYALVQGTLAISLKGLFGSTTNILFRCVHVCTVLIFVGLPTVATVKVVGDNALNVRWVEYPTSRYRPWLFRGVWAPIERLATFGMVVNAHVPSCR
eukprot:PhM_4_TR3045/c3_g2_i4/m.45487